MHQITVSIIMDTLHQFTGSGRERNSAPILTPFQWTDADVKGRTHRWCLTTLCSSCEHLQSGEWLKISHQSP